MEERRLQNTRGEGYLKLAAKFDYEDTSDTYNISCWILSLVRNGHDTMFRVSLT